MIRQLVKDLDIPVRIEICPTVREPDGLAMSSRNELLSANDRARAAALHRSLQAARAAVQTGELDPATVLTTARAELTAERIEPDYLELVSSDTLSPVDRIEGDVLAVVAARLGETRLIDNLNLNPNGRH